MTAQELIAFIRARFYAEIQLKTGWGKNEILLAFERATADGLACAIEEVEK